MSDMSMRGVSTQRWRRFAVDQLLHQQHAGLSLRCEEQLKPRCLHKLRGAEQGDVTMYRMYGVPVLAVRCSTSQDTNDQRT